MTPCTKHPPQGPIDPGAPPEQHKVEFSLELHDQDTAGFDEQKQQLILDLVHEHLRLTGQASVELTRVDAGSLVVHIRVHHTEPEHCDDTITALADHGNADTGLEEKLYAAGLGSSGLQTLDKVVVRPDPVMADELHAKIQGLIKDRDEARAKSVELDNELRAMHEERERLLLEADEAEHREQEQATALKKSAEKYMSEVELLNEVTDKCEKITASATVSLVRLTTSSVDAGGMVDADVESDVGSSLLSEQTKEVRNALEAEHVPGLAAAFYAEHIVDRLATEALAMKEAEAAKNDQAHKDIVRLEDTLETTKGEIEDTKQELEDAWAQCETMHEHIEKLDAENKTLREEMSSHLTVHEQVKAKHENTTADLLKTQSEHQAKSQEHQMTQSELKEAMQAHNEEKARYESSVADLKREVARHKEERDKHHSELTTKRSSLTETLQETSQLKDQLADLKETEYQLTQALEEKSKEKSREIMALRREKDDEIKQISTELARLEEDNAALMAENTDHLEKHEVHAAQKEEMEATGDELEDLRAVAAESEQVENELRDQIDVLESDVKDPRMLSLRRAERLFEVVHEVEMLQDLADDEITDEDVDRLSQLQVRWGEAISPAVTPPRRHAATPPRRHAATPPRHHATTPPCHHATMPPRHHLPTS